MLQPGDETCFDLTIIVSSPSSPSSSPVYSTPSCRGGVIHASKTMMTIMTMTMMMMMMIIVIS